MTASKDFDLSVLFERLDELRLDHVKEIPFTDLEWILSDFAISGGQRLLLDPNTWSSVPQCTSLHNFGKIYLPFSTASDFPLVNPQQIRTLALASSCLTLYAFVLDHLVDEPTASPVAAKAAIQPLLFHCYCLLNQLFPVNSPFWNEAKRVFDLTSQAVLRQYEMYRKPIHPLSLEEFKRIAHGIMAFVQINCVGLAILNNTPERIPILNKCWEAIGLTAIIHDEIYDWQQDYCNANYTYLLSQVLFSPSFREDIMAGHLPKLREIGAALFCTDLVESLYELAYQELQVAEDNASAIDCPALTEIIREYKKQEKCRFEKILSRKMATVISMNESHS